ncbi:MAG TPA: TetR family transcriptional regulator [Thermoleophilaceae bacterium]|nr:TetR family transcriptional regulator [Thermoleophilaceae bacterium]
MADAVKTRAYNSPRRREQAAATRRQILDAAQKLFERQGFGATTMATIASEAGVALKTVYVAFETKSGVLRALWNLLLRGDDEDVPVAERAWYREVLEEPDPAKTLRLNARNARRVKERVGGVLGVIREAAPLDPDIAALWDRIESDFYDNQRTVLCSIGLDADAAADVLWTLNHPDVWLLLVGRRGWTPEQWERWFADTACAQLLPRSLQKKPG